MNVFDFDRLLVFNGVSVGSVVFIGGGGGLTREIWLGRTGADMTEVVSADCELCIARWRATPPMKDGVLLLACEEPAEDLHGSAATTWAMDWALLRELESSSLVGDATRGIGGSVGGFSTEVEDRCEASGRGEISRAACDCSCCAAAPSRAEDRSGNGDVGFDGPRR